MYRALYKIYLILINLTFLKKQRLNNIYFIILSLYSAELNIIIE
jgi:hypothetical protein